HSLSSLRDSVASSIGIAPAVAYRCLRHITDDWEDGMIVSREKVVMAFRPSYNHANNGL
ncbi:hypothetical protein L9F63_018942, partial [Diploptera punctata]